MIMKETNKTVRTTFSLPEDQYNALQTLAQKHGLSIAWLMRQATADFLEKSDKLNPLSNDKDGN